MCAIIAVEESEHHLMMRMILFVAMYMFNREDENT